MFSLSVLTVDQPVSSSPNYGASFISGLAFLATFAELLYEECFKACRLRTTSETELEADQKRRGASKYEVVLFLVSPHWSTPPFVTR